MTKVEHTLETLPPLTKAEEDNLKRLAAMPDDGIDYDDMPALTDTQLAEMQRDRFYAPLRRRSQRGWMPMCWRGSSRKARATSPA